MNDCINIKITTFETTFTTISYDFGSRLLKNFSDLIRLSTIRAEIQEPRSRQIKSGKFDPYRMQHQNTPTPEPVQDHGSGTDTR